MRPYLSLKDVERAIPEMQRRGVSAVARGDQPSTQTQGGFISAYKRARGDWSKLKRLSATQNTSWHQRRNKFVARHVAQAKKNNELWWKGGQPTRRHLSLVAWAYSPTPKKFRKWIMSKRRNPRVAHGYWLKSEGVARDYAQALRKIVGSKPKSASALARELERKKYDLFKTSTAMNTLGDPEYVALMIDQIAQQRYIDRRGSGYVKRAGRKAYAKHRRRKSKRGTYDLSVLRRNPDRYTMWRVSVKEYVPRSIYPRGYEMHDVEAFSRLHVMRKAVALRKRLKYSADIGTPKKGTVSAKTYHYLRKFGDLDPETHGIPEELRKNPTRRRRKWR